MMYIGSIGGICLAKRITSLLIALMLLTAAAHAATIYGSLPDDGIYVAQEQKHTCTLVAATMMARNYAFQNGEDYSRITVDAMKKVCWSSYGLAHNFAIGDVSVMQSTEIGSAKDKKEYLINQLCEHPEGIVIYNSKQPHAVFLFGYRADTDTFFCADTTGKNSLQMIALEETLLKGEGQQGKINGLNKIWHIK